MDIAEMLAALHTAQSVLGDLPAPGLQLIAARHLAATHHPPGSPQQGLLILAFDSLDLAPGIRRALQSSYPDDHPLTLILSTEPPVAGQTLPLAQLDQLAADQLAVVCPGAVLWAPPLSHPGGYEALQEVIAHLRAPDGCPWDREQTHLSLRPYLLEEVHEALEAIDAGDARALAEELGDVLIQVALHTQIAAEAGEFRLPDVIRHVVAKLIRRHPHVFGDVNAADAAAVARNWEAIKQSERQAMGVTKTLLDGVPRSLPALALAQTYIERLARVGYPLPPSGLQTADSLAAALFDLVEQAEAAGLDAESSLRQHSLALRQRVQQAQEAAGARGLALTAFRP